MDTKYQDRANNDIINDEPAANIHKSETHPRILVSRDFTNPPNHATKRRTTNKQMNLNLEQTDTHTKQKNTHSHKPQHIMTNQNKTGRGPGGRGVPPVGHVGFHTYELRGARRTTRGMESIEGVVSALSWENERLREGDLARLFGRASCGERQW